MTDESARKWLFNRSEPTPAELVLAREQSPFVVQCDYTGAFKLYSRVRRLDNGTHLGLVLTWERVDSDVGLMAPFDKPEGPYTDNRYSVIRLVVAECDGRIYSFEFSWLVSGALSTRFHPYNGTSSKALLNYVIRIFAPEDATLFSMLAQSTQRSFDFMKARFDELLLLHPWYEMTFIDVLFQEPCKFCVARGNMSCECPIIMRRRLGSPFDVISATACEPDMSERNSMWTDVGGVMHCTKRSGFIMFNVKVRVTPTDIQVPKSGIAPFSFALHLGITRHQVLQQFMVFSGSSMTEPTRRSLPNTILDDKNNESNLLMTNTNRTIPTTTTAISTIPQSMSSAAGAAGAAGSISLVSKPSQNAPTVSTNNSNNNQATGKNGSPQLRSIHALQAALHSLNNPTSEVEQNQVSTSAGNSAKESKRIGSSSSNDGNDEKVQLEDVARKALMQAMREVENAARTGIVKKKRAEKVFTCPECGIKVQNKRSNLTRHIENRHQNLRKFPCEFEGCTKRFQTKSNLERHVRAIHNE